MKLTEDQEDELRRMRGMWTLVSANCVDARRRETVRQQLKRKGLLVQDEKIRRLWKRTKTGCEMVP